ncbi:tetA [Symbiodinium natans]|uniref:TetA protein n=1 Tax=Symbiodinium natans TaxID=878477 RepID=A0A812JU74_9DINO|nr:tetA [Symbiodinium natans]
MPKVSAGAIWTVYLVVLLDMLNFGIVFPLLPSIAEHFGADATAVGSLATAFSVAQVVFTPILGRASDSFGRRPVLLVAVFGTMVSTAMTGFAWSFPMIVAARAINGASGGTVGIANAYIADATTGEEKSVYISYLQACNSIGIIIGPALGGVLSHLGFSVACYVSAGLSAINLVVGMVFLTEAKPRGNQAREAAASLTAAEGGAAQGEGATGTQVAAEEDRGESASRLQARQSSVDTGLDYIPWSAGLLFGAGFLFMLGFASFESVTGYYLMDTYYANDPNPQVVSGQFYGALFTVAGVTMFLTAVFVYKPLLRIFGENITIILGGIFRTLGFVGMAWAPTPFWFAVCAVFQVSGGNLISPTTSSLLTTICSKKIYGRALGYQQAFQSIARIFAPMIFGYLYDHYDKRITFWINAGTNVLAVPMIICVPRPRQEPAFEVVDANVTCMERQTSVPPSLDGTAHHPTLRRQLSGKTEQGPLAPSGTNMQTVQEAEPGTASYTSEA